MQFLTDQRLNSRPMAFSYIFSWPGWYQNRIQVWTIRSVFRYYYLIFVHCSQICSRIASSGRVVLAIEHRDGTAPACTPRYKGEDGIAEVPRLYLRDEDVMQVHHLILQNASSYSTDSRTNQQSDFCYPFPGARCAGFFHACRSTVLPTA